MANIFGLKIDPTPGFNLVSPSRWGQAGLIESSRSHGAHDAELAVKANKATQIINGKIYDSTGKYLGEAPPAGDGGATNEFIGGGTVSPEAVMEAQRMAKVQALRDEIMGKRGNVNSAYEALFGDLTNLVRARAADVERDAGDNINKLTEQYTASIPQIESSYSALGAGDSTDTRDAKIGAETGYKEGVSTVGKNKDSDLSKIGQYEQETKAGWNADKNSIMRLLSRVDETDDEGDLREARNSIEDKLDSATAGRAKLATDEGARGALSKLTSDGGRFDAIKASLDNIVNSSMANGVKGAAVQAVVNSNDLNDEDKEKVRQQYGNIYGDTVPQA